MLTDGADAALERVYGVHADMLYRIAVSILRSDADAQDAVQNAFCRYLDKLPEFSDAEHEKAWLIRVTVNQCRDLMRRRKVRAWLPFETLADVGVRPKETPALDALGALPDKYRITATLYLLEELSVDEIAAALSLSPSAVKMRLSRAREQMRKILDEERKEA